MKKSLFLSFIFLIPFLLFSGNKRVITWDKIGQIETIKKGEEFDFLYRNANPENTRIILKPSNRSDEFTLELNRYNIVDKAMENKKSDQVANDSLVKVLQKENSSLVLRVKNNKIYIEDENKISQKLSQTIDRINVVKDRGKNLSDESISQMANKDIQTIQKNINSNLSELDRNKQIIQSIKEKISRLGNSKEENMLGKQLTLIVDSLEQKNTFLSRINQLLLIDKNLLLKDKQIAELQIAKEKNIRNLFVFIAIISLIFALFYYRSFRVIRKSANLLRIQKTIIDEEREKADKLLLNILPEKIATRLKNGETLIADHIDNATIVFIDIANFTKLSSNADAKEVVEFLNEIFTKFDNITLKYNMEKIKTIGDSYMAASGVPIYNENHALNAALMAIEIKSIMQNYTSPDGVPIKVRIGLETGPIVAGVIGKSKFIYDLWGDTVNTASRMESTGIVEEIQITDNLKNILEASKSSEHKFNFKSRGEIDIKGKGMMKTWFMS